MEKVSVQVIKDLIEINNERIAEYKKAIENSEELGINLRGSFKYMINESRQNITELLDQAVKKGNFLGPDSNGTVYTCWMINKTSFVGHDRLSMLNACEFGEGAVLKAYDEALGSNMITEDLRLVLQRQKATLKVSHNLIRKYRDLHMSIQD